MAAQRCTLTVTLRGTLAALALALLGTSHAAVGASAGVAGGQRPAQRNQEPPLRVFEPVDDIIFDLQTYIPARMRQAGVPGLAISLIRDYRVVWTAGFGVANRITRTPVTPATAFEVASNSKVVTTYAALRLVDQGRLSLDRPVATYLTDPWLPPARHAEVITLRHLASHSSGLSDNLFPLDKSIAFQPGTDFLYSGVGALYMQEAIEQVTGKSLEQAARELVFQPLDMLSSSFVNTPDILRRMANGHMNCIFPLLAFLIPFVGLLVAILLVGIPFVRMSTGQWHPPRKMWLGILTLAVVLTLLLHGVVIGTTLPNLTLFSLVCALVFALAVILALMITRRLLALAFTRRPRAGPHRVLSVIVAVVAAIVLLRLSASLSVPIPRIPSPRPSAVGSLRTTALDLANFLIELVNPRFVSRSLAAQIRTPQIRINHDFSWGLGIGIQHSEQGDALWQMGMTFGFKSVMVIYPRSGWGIVVLTNSDDGLPVAYDIAARALGGKARWEFF
jgi:CubicO group peptidase (beta-lactamase class C family)